jgi:hypothetical protein
MALVDEFVHSWRAEVQEYDITPTGGMITLSLPNDREFRIARTKARLGHIQRMLEVSDDILGRSTRFAGRVQTYLDTARTAASLSRTR